MKALPFLVLLISFNVFSQKNADDKSIQEDDLQLFIASPPAGSDQEAFHQAVKSDAYEITKYLLSKGADPNKPDTNGSTALIAAVTNVNTDLVDLLIKNGANVNQHQESGLKATALMYAGYSNEKVIIDRLIQRGAKINDVDMNNDPAINWAAYYGNTVAMRTLIGHGADLTIKSKHGLPVDVALRLWHADSVAAVFREFSYGVELSKNEKSLVDAVRNGEGSEVRKLLKKGVSADAKDQLGTPLVHIVAEEGDLSLLEILSASGANLSQLNRVGQSALAIAARFGHQKIVKYLLNNGVNPNLAGEEYALTPLIGAAINGSAGIIEMLLNAGAQIELVDVVNQAPPLHWALFYRNEEAAIALMGSGADFTQTSLDGQYNAVDIAESYDLERVLDWIQRIQNPLLGSWVIKKIDYIYPDTTYVLKMNVPGRFVVTPKSYAIMYNPFGEERNSPVDMSTMTDQEKLYSFQTVVFNSGSYEVNDSTLTTTADIAKVAGFEGGIQYYKIAKEQEEVSITMFDETYPSGKKPAWYGKVEVRFVLAKED